MWAKSCCFEKRTLAALAYTSVGRGKDKARIEQLLQHAELDRPRLETILQRHKLTLPTL